MEETTNVNCGFYDFGSDSNKSIIFADLSDMFGNLVSPSVIIGACEKLNWKVEDCVSWLISFVEEHRRNDFDKIEMESSSVIENKFQNFNESTDDPTVDIVIEDEKICTPNEMNNIATLKKPNNTVTQKDFTTVLNYEFEKLDISPTTSNSFLKIKNIIDKLKVGCKLMIIMRGPPGCGKSYLANEIILFMGKDSENHIFSTDDYFINKQNKKYVFKKEELPIAHKINQEKVRKSASRGQNPIIIDNTNIRKWEMSPYVKIAIEYRYEIEILQPDNGWCNSAEKLAMKNRHGVPKHAIQRMLSDFEPCTVQNLLEMHGLGYAGSVPRVNNYNQPLLTSASSSYWNSYMEGLQSFDYLNQDINNAFHKQRKTDPIEMANLTEGITLTNHSNKNNENKFNESIKYENICSSNYFKNDCCASSSKDPFNLMAGMEKSTNNNNNNNYNNNDFGTYKTFKKHKLNCQNESKLFCMLRQIFHNKEFIYLWNVFVKYDGDLNKSIESILKNDNDDDGDDLPNSEYNKPLLIFNDDYFICECDQQINNEMPYTAEKNLSIDNKMGPSFADVLKSPQCLENLIKKELNAQNLDESDDNNLIELNLGGALINQLESSFSTNTNNFVKYSSIIDLKPNVLMPKNFAKKLYVLWLESLYSQMQEKSTVKVLNNSLENETQLKTEEKIRMSDKQSTVESNKIPQGQIGGKSNTNRSCSEKLDADEIKKMCLRNFEENRNKAVHYSQLKSECYEKAKYAIQRGQGLVAVYYSQVADSNRNKVDVYNQKAASYIMEMQFNQDIPDSFDLHYLHVNEARECFDIFIDAHLDLLKANKIDSKNVYIITGRGLHSVNGISTIKNIIKNRIKDRNLKWTEINPGFLKVKISITNKFSQF